MSGLPDLLAAAYPWVKAAHVTFVIFWMAGLFILPRFYVYHHETTPGSADNCPSAQALPLEECR